MEYREQGWSTTRAQLLMDVSAALADYSQSLELAREIPEYLAHTFQLEAVTLALIHDAAPGTEPTVFHASSSKALGDNGTNLSQDLIHLYKQIRPLAPNESPTLRGTFNLAHTEVSEMAIQRPAGFARATVFSRIIDAQFRLVLIVHQRTESAPLSSGSTELLQLIANQLVKFLGCLIAWLAKPAALGAPFDRLTEREWVVLRALNSEAGEKQLADQLGLSPHTLHSHIKSIYRKAGVQGRLPLLLQAQAALRSLRSTRFGRVGAKREAPAKANLAVAAC
jgi:DNA-binding CsgD family transcriptional regulator